MGRAVFQVVQVGPLVTIQDGGRSRLMRFGVPQSGPMDRTAFAAANLALGNAIGATGIEISLGGLTLECVEGAVTLAVAGGGFQVFLDEASIGAWSVATVRAGSRLIIKPGHWGSWTYLTFAGGLRAERWLGSAATLGYAGLGGGRLAAGQRLEVEDADIRGERCGDIPLPVPARPRHTVKVVLGPQDRFFPPAAIDGLCSEPFRLSDAYDRMGVRLRGPPLRPSVALDMPSEAIVRGSIQVSGDGVATVLLADHQTTGGYPKIATIVDDDLDGFAQLRSRDLVRFTAVSREKAVELARARRHLHRQWIASLSAGSGARDRIAAVHQLRQPEQQRG